MNESQKFRWQRSQTLHGSGSSPDTYDELKRLHRGVVALVDGDAEGQTKLAVLLKANPPPASVLVWRSGWEMEDAIVWILRADEAAVIAPLNSKLNTSIGSLDELLARFKVKEGPGRLKTDYLAYEEIAGVIRDTTACRERARVLLDALTCAILGNPEGCAALVTDTTKSTATTKVIRIEP